MLRLISHMENKEKHKNTNISNRKTWLVTCIPVVEKQKLLVGGGAIFNPSTWEAQTGRSMNSKLA